MTVHIIRKTQCENTHLLGYLWVLFHFSTARIKHLKIGAHKWKSTQKWTKRHCNMILGCPKMRVSFTQARKFLVVFLYRHKWPNTKKKNVMNKKKCANSSNREVCIRQSSYAWRQFCKQRWKCLSSQKLSQMSSTKVFKIFVR